MEFILPASTPPCIYHLFFRVICSLCYLLGPDRMDRRQRGKVGIADSKRLCFLSAILPRICNVQINEQSIPLELAEPSNTENIYDT